MIARGRLLVSKQQARWQHQSVSGCLVGQRACPSLPPAFAFVSLLEFDCPCSLCHCSLKLLSASFSLCRSARVPVSGSRSLLVSR
eukprot:35329-Alexandrium_andersonii.AAC.1